MLDLLYLLGTMAFFGLMLGYIRFCERIGAPAADSTTETRP
ncbi:MAG: hypothetical protein ABIT20_09735 [Gemmatimonadaceae bacterium]